MENELGKSWSSQLGSALSAKTWPSTSVLAGFTDSALIFELLSRGYAVAKISAQDLADGLAV